MNSPKYRPRPAPMLLALLLLLTGCVNASLPLSRPVVVEAPRIPPLQPLARQPMTPQECSPSCSAGVSRVLDSWLPSPTIAAQPGPPASSPMKP